MKELDNIDKSVTILLNIQESDFEIRLEPMPGLDDTQKLGVVIRFNEPVKVHKADIFNGEKNHLSKLIKAQIAKKCLETYHTLESGW